MSVCINRELYAYEVCILTAFIKRADDSFEAWPGEHHRRREHVVYGDRHVIS